MNAIEFCKKHDKEHGETWSNDYRELPEIMEQYAKIYHEQQLKILNIPYVIGCNFCVCGGGDWADASVDYFINLTKRKGEELLQEYDECGGFYGNNETWFRDWAIEKGYCRIPADDELEVCWEL